MLSREPREMFDQLVLRERRIQSAVMRPVYQSEITRDMWPQVSLFDFILIDSLLLLLFLKKNSQFFLFCF